MSDSLAALLVRRSRLEPDAPALSVGATTYSWRRLHRLASGLAGRVGEIAGPRRLRVGVVAGPSAALPFLIWAAVLRDDDLVFLPALPGADQLRATAAAQRAELVFAAGAAVPEGSGVLPLDELFGELLQRHANDNDDGTDLAPEPAAPQGTFVFQTSGTEGEPKTVVTPYRRYRQVIDAMQSCGALDHADRQTCFISQPLYHSYGLCSYLEYTACASHTILPAGQSPLGPVGELTDPQLATRITAAEGVPHFWSLAARLAERIRAPQLRHLGVGGGRLDVPVMRGLLERLPGATVSVRYGLTETPSVVTHKVYAAPYPADWQSSGRVVPAYRVEIVKADGSAAASGEEGEVVVSGDCVAVADGVLRTGDLGYFSAEGELHITGRKSAFIKHRGYRLSPEPIESALMQFPGIRDCRVRGADEQLIAELVEDPPVARRELIAHLRGQLPAHGVPDRFVTVAAVARTYSGKIKRGS